MSSSTSRLQSHVCGPCGANNSPNATFERRVLFLIITSPQDNDPHPHRSPSPFVVWFTYYNATNLLSCRINLFGIENETKPTTLQRTTTGQQQQQQQRARESSLKLPTKTLLRCLCKTISFYAHFAIRVKDTHNNIGGKNNNNSNCQSPQRNARRK